MWHDLWPTWRVAHPDYVDHERRPLPTWISPPLQALSRSLSARRTGESGCKSRTSGTPVIDIPDEEFWEVRQRRTSRRCSPICTSTARRRWASGERRPQAGRRGRSIFATRTADDRVRAPVRHLQAGDALVQRPRSTRPDPDQSGRPVQLIFAGKAHPADDGGKRLIQEIFWRSLDPRFEGRHRLRRGLRHAAGVQPLTGVSTSGSTTLARRWRRVARPA